MNLEKEIFDISLTDIIPNRFQPREIFDDEALKELSQSIKEHGVIQPIIVRKIGDKYEIIAGERRFRASQLAGKQTVPALVRDIDDKEAAKIALLENLQRSNLTPIEEAKTYQTILKIDNITQEELAQNLGKSQSTIANKLRLLTLNDEVQTALLNSQISERHARSLIGLDHDKQTILLNKTLTEKLTVRQLDEEVQKIASPSNNTINNNQFEVSVVENNNKGEQPMNNIETQVAVPIHNLSNIEQSQPSKFQQQTPTQITKEEPNKFSQIIPPQENIFDKLRINRQETQINENIETNEKSIIPNQAIINNSEQSNYNNIYDLRFAINNFRQAIQNTEKFGFKVKANEYDSETKYQIVIEIQK